MAFTRLSTLYLGIILLIGTVLMLTVIIPVGVVVPKSNFVPSLSPDFWINIIVWATFGLSLQIIYSGIREAWFGKGPERIADDEIDLGQRYLLGQAVIRALCAVVFLFIYFFLIIWLGMVAASVTAMIGFVLLSGERRFKIIVPLVVVLPVGLYYFFLKVASIPMPLGVFG